MPVITIDDLSDPRVAAYANLKDRELAREGDRFIAEGEFIVRRLLASQYPVESVLLAEKRLERMLPVLPPEVPVYVAPSAVVNGVLGYKFHSGVMAVGRRVPAPGLDELLAAAPGPVNLLVCPNIINHDNLGTLIRIAAGFGVTAMLVGELSCDPFWRRSIRVSMGTIFSLPLIHSRNLRADLQHLRDRWDTELVAAVLDNDAVPLEQLVRPASGRLAVLVGSEAQGLDRADVNLCQRKAILPMQLGTDSLNVSVAAAVFLYHFTRVAPTEGA